MFKFLKDKLSGALSKFTKKAEEAPPAEEKAEPAVTIETPVTIKEEKKEQVVEEAKEVKPSKKEEKEPEVKKEEKEAEKELEVKKEEIKKQVEEKPKEEKKGFFTKLAEKVTATKISEERFDELFWELEVALMENNVAFEVVEKIKRDLKSSLVGIPIKRSEIKDKVHDSLKSSIESLFSSSLDLVSEIKNSGKPYVIVFLGINGSGKTTTISKFVYYLKNNHISSVIAASDTFRAAAIHQLEEHGNALGVKVVKHDYGADPAAVAFDAEKYARAHNIDVVLVDTAGRMHSNQNLVDELKKIVRVAKPNLKIFVGEAIAGNDCVEQAKTFNDAVGLDGIILAKSDIDEKGGAAISVSYVTGKPIMFLGVGQGYGDLEFFDKARLVKSIGL